MTICFNSVKDITIINIVKYKGSNYVTYSMFNKKRKLPVICPITNCDADYGSIQAVIKSGSVFFKIRHYSSKLYQEALEELKTTHQIKKDKLSKTQRSHLRSSGQVWHCFRSSFFRDIDNLVTHKIISKTAAKQIEKSFKMKTITLTKNSKFLQIIKQNGGWNMRENHSERYKGRAKKQV